MSRVLRRVLCHWTHDAFRLAENERSVRADATGWRLAARSMVVLNLLGSLLMRDTFLRELLRRPCTPSGHMCLLVVFRTVRQASTLDQALACMHMLLKAPVVLVQLAHTNQLPSPSPLNQQPRWS